MITNCKNILVLAPHTDDGELGLGGTISRLIEDGKKVTYVAFSTAQQSVPEGFPKDILKTEVKQATQTLGIEPENLIIYNYEVRKLGYARQEILEELIGYELIWNNLTFNTQCFVRLEERHIDAKVESLKAYKSQGARDYLSKDFIYSLARARGVQAGCTYAEAFEVVRLFL